MTPLNRQKTIPSQRPRAGWRFVAAWLIALACLAVPAQAGPVRDGEIEALLRDYTRPLFVSAGLNPETVGITIINDKALNAFVTRGQNIFVHSGLILESDSPNMVIGVMAHEIGHITGGHLARSSDAIGRAQAPAMIATILGFGSLLAGNPEAAMALISGGQQIAMRSYLSYSRAQEASADVTALQLLDATEQSPNGIIDLMDTLASQEILNEVYQDPYARSHPMSRDRVNAYIEGASKSRFGDQKDDTALVFRHQMAKAKLFGFIDKPEVTLRRYKGDTSTPAKYARAIAYHQMAKLDTSVALIDELIAQFPDNPWFYELKGQVYYESGRAKDGLASYEKAVSLRPEEPLLLIGLAMCQIGTGIDGGAINQQAIDNIRIALRLDRENLSAYHQLSKAYGQLNRPAYAQWALAEYHALVRSPEAASYARRAIRGLPENSVEYLRARDILKMTF
jgi:predicted Zn-dependent protease